MDQSGTRFDIRVLADPKREEIAEALKAAAVNHMESGTLDALVLGVQADKRIKLDAAEEEVKRYGAKVSDIHSPLRKWAETLQRFRK